MSKDDPTVRFRVAEGRVSEIKLLLTDQPQSPRSESDCLWSVERLVYGTLRHLMDLPAVTIRDIEHYVLLAEDIPGVTVRPVLRPSDKEVGGVTMIAQVDIDHWEVRLLTDDRGPSFSGPRQFLATEVVQGFTHGGERFQLTEFATPSREQQFIQGSVEFAIDSRGDRLEVYGGYGDSHPSGSLDILGYRGKLIMGGIRLGIPLVRLREWGLWFRPEAYVSNARINVDDPSDAGGEIRQSESNVRAVRGALSGYYQPSLYIHLAPEDLDFHLFGRGVLQGELAFNQGLEIFGATSRTTVLASRVGADENFSKVTGEVEATLPLFSFNNDRTFTLSAFGRGAGQYSKSLLLASEKFAAGGRLHGRGYYAGQVSGDQGFSGTAELRLDHPFVFRDDFTDQGLNVNLQLYGFYDYAALFDNGEDDVRRRKVESTGGGIRLLWGSWAEIELEAVRRMELKPLGDDEDALKPWEIYSRFLIKG